MSFQQPVIQPETPTVKVQNLHPITTAVNKYEQAAIGRVGFELAADYPAEPIDPFSHVGGRRVDEDLAGRAQVQHNSTSQSLT